MNNLMGEKVTIKRIIKDIIYIEEYHWSWNPNDFKLPVDLLEDSLFEI
jgi:hypothetical protein